MIQIKHYSFTYEGQKTPVLQDINLTIPKGEFLLLTGRSGCGKTTLIRCLNRLIPTFYPGTEEGELLLDGESLKEQEPLDLVGQLGTVFQDPRSQFFMTDTSRELAFGCENMGYTTEKILDRVSGAVADLKLSDLLNRSIFALSSGEKQQIAVGSVYALAPGILIFDEPSANLDDGATRRLAEVMGKLKAAGCTIIVVEHRFFYLRDLIDRAVLLEDGTIRQEMTGAEFSALPEHERISYGLRTCFPKRAVKQKNESTEGEPALIVDGLFFGYPGRPPVIQNFHLRASPGDVIGIVGHNGCGKTTLISVLTGLLKETGGEIRWYGKRMKPKQRRKLSYLVLQDVDYQLFGSSVSEELSLGNDALTAEEKNAVLEQLKLTEYAETHPAALSGGQKQRVTIGAAVASNSPIVFFDEPTSGLDYDSMVRVSELIRQLSAQGIIVFVVSHDTELLVRTCTKTITLGEKEGRTIQAGSVEEEGGTFMFQKVFDYAGPHKKEMLRATFVVLLSVLMGVLPFVLAYQIIAPLIMGQPFDAAFAMLRIGGILLCLVLQALLYGWGLNLSHNAAYKTLFRLRSSLQQRFESLPMGTIEEKGTGTIKKLFVDDVDSLEVLLAHSLPEGIANLMIPLVVIVSMFFVDWKLALLSLAAIPLSLAAMMIMYSVGMKKMGPYYAAGQKMNNTIIEYINGMEVVKVFNRDADSFETFRKDVTAYRDFTLDWYKASWPWMAVYSCLMPCTILLTLPLGSWFVLKGWSTLPDLLLVLCLALSIGVPLLKSLSFLPTMPQVNYKISALEQVLASEPLQQAEKSFKGASHDISFDHITFGYSKTDMGPDGKPVVTVKDVLHDVSFTVRTGQKTAIVGESGSGKSTLAKLLVHYYDPQQGTISIGGQKLTDMSLEALNNQISYVAQDQYLFNTSILENIRVGRPTATDEEVLQAAEKAQCMEFLNRLPDGIHSSAGDAGKMLSGGQRQRISLARAILKDAPIVVLDEATAYADPENEEKMEAAIAKLVEGKTLFVIAHKLPAVMDADQICVMDHGIVAGIGRHAELLDTCPAYRKLWEATEFSSVWKIDTAKEDA